MAAHEKETYFDRIKKLEPIASFTQDQFEDLVAQSSIERLDAGAILFREGDKSCDNIIYILSGSIELTSNHPEQSTVLIKGGNGDALHPLDDKPTHQMNATTITPSVIARIDRETLNIILTWGQISVPETEVMMSEDGIIIINKADWLKVMMKSPTFRALPPSNIAELLQRLEPMSVHAGDIIIRQGDKGDYFYMINDGTALVTRNPDNDEDSVEMAELNFGATFGEAALISDSPRNATISMMTDGLLLRLSKDDFNILLKQPSLEEISFNDAQLKIDNGSAQWIDVRLPAEFEHDHLPGAANIPVRDIHRRIQELDASKTWICYCESGRRSAAATFILGQYNLNSMILKGGLHHAPDNKTTH